MMDYWEECIAEAFEDAGITATKEQIDTVASWVEGAHENYGMAHGYDAIPNPLESEIGELKRKHKKEMDEQEEREECYKRSVARRRNVNSSDVYLEDGTVYVRLD